MQACLHALPASAAAAVSHTGRLPQPHGRPHSQPLTIQCSQERCLGEWGEGASGSTISRL